MIELIAPFAAWGTYELLKKRRSYPLFPDSMNVQDYARHSIFMGLPGKGKTTLMMLMSTHCIQNGWSLIWICCQGEAWKLVSMLPGEFIEHMVPFYPCGDRVLGYNPLMLKKHTEAEMDRVASSVAATFKEQNTRSWGDEIQRAVTFAVKAVLIGERTPNLLQVWKLMHDETYRSEVLESVTDPVLHEFFHSDYLKMSTAIRKIGSPLSNSTMLSVLSQDGGLDLLECMNSRRIVVADLDEEGMGPASKSMGALLLSGIRHASSMRSERSQPCMVCIDEWQVFAGLAGESVRRLLELMRKKNMALCLAFHHTDQMPDDLKESIWLAGNRFIFDPDPMDHSELKAAFGEDWLKCQGLPDRSFLSQITLKGQRMAPIVRTMPEVHWLRTQQESLEVINQRCESFPTKEDCLDRARRLQRARRPGAGEKKSKRSGAESFVL